MLNVNVDVDVNEVECEGVDEGEGEGEGGRNDSEGKFNADCGRQPSYIEKCTIRLRVPSP